MTTVDPSFISSDPTVQSALQQVHANTQSTAQPYNEENAQQFAALLDQEQLDPEFRARLSQTIQQFSQLPSNNLSSEITHAHGELMATFGTDLPEIGELQSFAGISDPNELQKAQMNMSLISFNSQIANLSPENQRLALSQLGALNASIETQNLQNQLNNLQQNPQNQQGLGFNLMNIENMSPDEIRYTIEAQLTQMYQPLIDLGTNSSNDDDDDDDQFAIPGLGGSGTNTQISQFQQNNVINNLNTGFAS